ncbi:hypothetical protein RYX36_017816 [Vicia faba]
MSYRRDNRSSKSSLLDGLDSLEEGGIRASSSYSPEINEHDNDKAINTLQDRVSFLKQLTGDIHEEVESHNSMLDRVGNKMDGSRGMMLGTMDRFKKGIGTGFCRFLRRNRQGKHAHLWDISHLASYSYTILLGCLDILH